MRPNQPRPSFAARVTLPLAQGQLPVQVDMLGYEALTKQWLTSQEQIELARIQSDERVQIAANAAAIETQAKNELAWGIVKLAAVTVIFDQVFPNLFRQKSTRQLSYKKPRRS